MTLDEIQLALSFDDVLLVPQYSKISSRSDVDLSTKLSEKIKLKVPLISANMDKVTGVKMAIAMGKIGGLGVLPRFEDPNLQADKVAEIKKANVYAAASIGIKNGYLERAEKLVSAGADILNVDVAHGHMKRAIDATKSLRDKFGNNITIISGIVATGDAAEAHYKAGADCIASGVGSGSICTTRIQAGSGVPGLASLLDIAPVARKYKKTFLPLAGIKNSGDIVKSLAAGASAVWGGFIFAGVKETPGEVIEIGGRKFKEYNGSTSREEKIEQVKKYSDGKSHTYTKHIEGVEGYVPYKGSLAVMSEKLLAGVRSGLAYSGANNIESFWEKAQFIRVTGLGVRESNSHGILEKEASN